jgi:hypothetical protein
MPFANNGHSATDGAAPAALKSAGVVVRRPIAGSDPLKVGSIGPRFATDAI